MNVETKASRPPRPAGGASFGPVLVCLAVSAGFVVGCGDDITLQIQPLEPVYQKYVNETFVINLRVIEPIGGEHWIVTSPFVDFGANTLAQDGATAVFRWTPLAADVGQHDVTFTVTTERQSDSETVRLEVLQEFGVPAFLQPGSGQAVDLDETPCVDIAIEVKDDDSPEVEIRMGEPASEPPIEVGRGEGLIAVGHHSARWYWCPELRELTARDYRLFFEADDGQNPPVVHQFHLLLQGGSRADCEGDPPEIEILSPADEQELATPLDYEIMVEITDDLGIKDAPRLHYSFVAPDDELSPDLTEEDWSTLLFMKSGENEYRTYIPNLRLGEGAEQAIYFVVSATDNDDLDGIACDHETISEVRRFVVSGAPSGDPLGYCEPCSNDTQCLGLCASIAQGTFCGSGCGAGCDEGVCQGIVSVDGVTADQCLPLNGMCIGDATDCVDDGLGDNSTAETATPIPPNTSLEGYVCAPDADYFSLEMVGGYAYEVSATGWDPNLVDIDIYLQNIDVAGPLPASMTFSDTERFEYCPQEDALYYIVVRSWGGGAGPYTLSVGEAEGPCCANDVPEPLNGPDDFLALPSIFCDVGFDGIICPGDTDCFAVYTGQPGTLSLSLSCDGTGADLDVLLYDALGLPIIDSADNTPSCAEAVGAEVANAGYYIVCVTGYGPSDSAPYRLECTTPG